MYTYKDVRATFNPKAKTWTLRLSRFSQETYGCRSRLPRRDDKEMFARYVNEKHRTARIAHLKALDLR